MAHHNQGEESGYCNLRGAAAWHKGARARPHRHIHSRPCTSDPLQCSADRVGVYPQAASGGHKRSAGAGRKVRCAEEGATKGIYRSAESREKRNAVLAESGADGGNVAHDFLPALRRKMFIRKICQDVKGN